MRKRLDPAASRIERIGAGTIFDVPRISRWAIAVSANCLEGSARARPDLQLRAARPALQAGCRARVRLKMRHTRRGNGGRAHKDPYIQFGTKQQRR